MLLSEIAGIDSDSEVTGFAIDHRKVVEGSVFGAFKGAVHRPPVAEVGLDRLDLAHRAERLQVPGEIRPPHRHPNAEIRLGKRAHHMPAEEAGTAEDGDECIVIAREHALTA